MTNLIPFVVIGLVSGSIYGLAGVGLVVTYKTSGIFNFAQGSIAALAVFLYYLLHVDWHVAWPISFAIAVAIFGPLMGIALEHLARILDTASDVLKIASTLGIVLIVLGLGQLWYPTTPQFPPYLPTSSVTILGVGVSFEQIAIIAISLALTAALYYFFRSVRLGIAMRSVVDDADLLAMTGERPDRVRRFAWIIGSTFAALSGLLLAPSLDLNGIVLTMLVIQAFGAAAIGYFSNLPLTYIGGLVIGLLGAISTEVFAQVPALAGLPPSLPFIVLFLALILIPRSKLSPRRFTPLKQLPEAWHAPPRVRTTFAIAILVFLCLIPTFVGSNLLVFSAAMVDVILFLSLGLVIRHAGQVSLCQYAFAAVGAAAMAHFTTSFGIPWLVSVLLAGLVAIPVGAIIAIPAMRLTGVFLSLATLGFGILLEQLFYTQSWMFGPTTSGVPASRPDLPFLNTGSDTGFYFVILIFVVGFTVLTSSIINGRLGRMLRAMADSPLALETQGATVNVVRVIIFCISAFIAAVSGALTASLFHFGVGTSFSSFDSLQLVALVVIITVGDPWYAFVAAFSLEVLPAYIDVGDVSVYLGILFGASALLSPLFVDRWRSNTPQKVRDLADRLENQMGRLSSLLRLRPEVAGRSAEMALPGTSAAAMVAPKSSFRPQPSLGLDVVDLSVRYGGAVAVSHLDLSAPMGSITALIGPNGAGKTSTFNVCSGLLKPASGRVLFGGEDITNSGPAARARQGIGRTFQRVELFGSLTVRENIAMGREAIFAGSNPFRQMVGRRGDRAAVASAVDQAVAMTGVRDILDRKVSQITTGQRRLIELARVLAGPFSMILLDEPSSGLDAFETKAFGEILQNVVKNRGMGILIVEHDMSLVREICNQIVVVDFGKKIFEGTPAAMLDSTVVKAAYLGTAF